MPSRVLPQKFYARSALIVGPELLGKILYCRRNGVLTAGRIVEVEAYLGSQDPASHGYRGETPRNRVMFGPPGFAYIYFTYGNHFCVNVVTGKEGVANALLIRALEPLEGLTAMKRRRKKSWPQDFTTGPGKLTQALRIGRGLNGHDLRREPLWIERDPTMKAIRWEKTRRIGISSAVNRLYRYVVKNSSYLSRRNYR